MTCAFLSASGPVRHKKTASTGTRQLTTCLSDGRNYSQVFLTADGLIGALCVVEHCSLGPTTTHRIRKHPRSSNEQHSGDHTSSCWDGCFIRRRSSFTVYAGSTTHIFIVSPTAQPMDYYVPAGTSPPVHSLSTSRRHGIVYLNTFVALAR